MQRQRFGDLLKRLVPLSGHDVDEILNEQRASNLRFGETAISMGLCRPEHVWRAWCGQSSDQVERVDLDEIGVDSQATPLIAREIAMRFGVLPVRVADGALVVATSDVCFEEASVGLPPLVHLKLKFVLAPQAQIQQALATYYPI
jgi:Type II secretion system (T2SS), protein E, N-terminal domain